MGSEVSLGEYFRVEVARYRVLRNNGEPCVDVNSFYVDDTFRDTFRDRKTGDAISYDKALRMLQDQARTLSRKSIETAVQENSRLVEHAAA